MRYVVHLSSALLFLCGCSSSSDSAELGFPTNREKIKGISEVLKARIFEEPEPRFRNKEYCSGVLKVLADGVGVSALEPVLNTNDHEAAQLSSYSACRTMTSNRRGNGIPFYGPHDIGAGQFALYQVKTTAGVMELLYAEVDASRSSQNKGSGYWQVDKADCTVADAVPTYAVKDSADRDVNAIFSFNGDILIADLYEISDSNDVQPNYILSIFSKKKESEGKFENSCYWNSISK